MKLYALIISVFFLNVNLFALNPLLPPGSNFDLSAWKLQTLDQNLLFTEISATSLQGGYTSSFFYTDPTDGSIVFKVPSNGGTTSGSSYPRVEFRQMTGGANWILNDPTEHYLTAQCKVLAVAQAKPQTIIGQIHGSNTVSEMIKLRWTGYKAGQCYIEARFKTNDAGMSEYGVTLANNLSLGDLITYTITMKNGIITCTVNGTTGSQTYTPDIWTLTDAYYFKAGDYLQYNPNSVSPPDPTVIYGQNQFYKLSLIKSTTEVSSISDINQFSVYPNPAKDKLQVSYQLSSTSNVSLEIFDWSGKLIKNLISNENQTTNNYIQTFDISDLSSGVYFAKLNTQTFSKTTKLLVIK
jgi:hypothetical protein